MTRKLFGACVGLLLLGPALSLPAEDCATLAACLAKYPSIAGGGSGVGEQERELAAAVQRYGATAIPPLLQMLESPRENVRALAGYTLRDIEGLTSEHLAPLMKARRNGDGWIPPAIARVGTPEAVAFLVEDLRSHPETHTQVTWALEMLGGKAALALTELMKCGDCDRDVLSAVEFVYAELKEKAAPAIPALLQIAADEKLSSQGRWSALLAIGSVGEAAQPYVPQLLALAKASPSMDDGVQSALAQMGAPEAVPALLKSLPEDPDGYLRQIAHLGKNGYSAGPALLPYLEYRDWDIRISAADALGRIGYLPARAALERALTDDDDWKLVYGAVLALSRLKSPASIEALARARDTHWYPPVSNLARAAIAHIEGGAEIEEPDFWEHTSIPDSPTTCSSVKEPMVNEPKSQKLRLSQHKRDLKRLAFDTSVVSFGPPEDAKPDEHGIIEVRPDNMVEHVAKRRQVPHVARKVEDGWLVGSDRGEWGGELVYLPPDGPSVTLHDGNVEDIYLLGHQLVATTGLAHMMMNRGFLLKIDRNDSGRYFAAPWKRLPAAPLTSWLIEGGNLLVNTIYGGSVVIDTAGRFRMAECTAVVSEPLMPPER